MLFTIMKIVGIIAIMVVIIMAIPWETLIKNIQFVLTYSDDMKNFHKKMTEKFEEVDKQAVALINRTEKIRKDALHDMQFVINERQKTQEQMLEVMTFIRNNQENIELLSNALDAESSTEKDFLVSKYLENTRQNLDYIKQLDFGVSMTAEQREDEDEREF